MHAKTFLKFNQTRSITDHHHQWFRDAAAAAQEKNASSHWFSFSCSTGFRRRRGSSPACRCAWHYSPGRPSSASACSRNSGRNASAGCSWAPSWSLQMQGSDCQRHSQNTAKGEIIQHKWLGRCASTLVGVNDCLQGIHKLTENMRVWSTLNICTN